jgi:Icc-related predicted phosphoesterase
MILGNDDARIEEDRIKKHELLWTYVHNRRIAWSDLSIYGYACVPPTPFMLKDWERYDVSRYVDPGCVSPEEGVHSIPADPHDVRYGTIARDLADLAPTEPLDRTIWLFHSPPYRTALDRADLAGRSIDHVPLDVHVGSIAIRRFIEERAPAITLHGHIHESARLTGRWLDRIGSTVMLSAAHDGPELALVSFDRDRPGQATRELLPAD